MLDGGRVIGRSIDQNTIQFLNSVSTLAIYIKTERRMERMNQDCSPWDLEKIKIVS